MPNKQVAEMGDKLLAFDGCMNFFAGPTDNQFKAEINLLTAPSPIGPQPPIIKIFPLLFVPIVCV